MHLAYADDSGTGNKAHAFQVMSIALIHDTEFRKLELLMGVAAEAIVPPGKLEEFEEFHAWEIYGGYGVFEGVDQTARFNVIKSLLEIVVAAKIPIIYGAVNKRRLNEMLYGSADPMDICFRICMQGIEKWMGEHHPKDFALLIVDDCESKDIKKTLRKSFRQFREKLNRKPEPIDLLCPLHLHDDMYFGNSKDSIGIQLADLCGYFISKHLRGNDVAAEGFYEIIKDCIVYQKVEPA